jgi:primosomal protein N' (replication factor Y)
LPVIFMRAGQGNQVPTMSTYQPEFFSDPDEDSSHRDQLTPGQAATVVFSEPPGGPFDYLLPAELEGSVVPGQRVRVPLGRSNRMVTGYCVALGPLAADTPYKLKQIDSVIDPQPLLSARMLELTSWMADYYVAGWGQVLEAVVPAGVRSRAGTREVTFYELADGVAGKLETIKLPAKQRLVMQLAADQQSPLSARQLADQVGCTLAPLKSLEKKGLLIATRRRVQLEEHTDQEVERESPLTLNSDQQAALDVILEACQSGQQRTVLLHGVTGSGKTEVYIQAIQRVVQAGRQAIVLVPEISLTPQTRHRFRSRFDQVAVLHSHMTSSQRHSHWRRIASGEVQVVIGARSAVFAPTPRLGLIVLDEEHEPSFKQETNPRYHARSVALRRTELENIPLVLGSATPSLESWQRTITGNDQLVQLPHRVLGRPLPEVSTIDLRNEYGRSGSRGAISQPLFQAMRQALDQQGQVILLLNRRGFSTSIQCPACGNVVRCPQCDVALTHHQASAGGTDRALCHYCDHESIAPVNCPECKADSIRFAGQGTQRLEAEVKARFKGISCLRMDSDTMRGANSHEQALERFRDGSVRVLVGTQMIAKGLDFPDVTLVGVINADTALHFPDFRAAERTFQLVTQVAGRTGRGERGGRVLVQTYSPDHPAIQAAVGHQFESFADQELPAREKFGFPPFSSMVRLIVRGEDQQRTADFAQQLVDQMTGLVADPAKLRTLGPAPAPITRLRGKYRFHALLISSEPGTLQAQLKQLVERQRNPQGIQWVVDVDPLSLL